MKTLKMFLIAVVLGLIISPPLLAQTLTVHTTLTTTLSDSQLNQVVVGSVTGIVASTVSAQTFCMINHEIFQVASTSGLTLTVRRATAGLASPHTSGAIVLCGPAGGSFDTATGNTFGVFLGGAFPRGRCTAANNQYLPVVAFSPQSNTWQIYNCNNAQWVAQNPPDDVGATFGRYCTVPSGAMAALQIITTFSTAGGFGYGTDTTPVAGTVYYATLELPRTRRVTGLAVLNGTVAGTDNVRFQIYRADGTNLGNTALAGTAAAGGIHRFQDIDLVSAVLLTGPARYWISYQTNGTTTRFKTVPSPVSAAQSAFTGMLGSSFTGGLSAGAAIGNLIGTAAALPTTLIGDTGPIACLY